MDRRLEWHQDRNPEKHFDTKKQCPAGGKPLHKPTSCFNLSAKEMDKRKASGKCFSCGGDHMVRNCPDNNCVNNSKRSGPPGASSYLITLAEFDSLTQNDNVKVRSAAITIVNDAERL